MSDLACCGSGMGEVVFSKPTIDARTDPTRPPTAIVDTATGLVTPIPPRATVTVLEPDPWWQPLVVLGGAILFIGAAAWLWRRALASAAELDDVDVVVRRRGRPVIVYDDEPAPIVLPSWRRSEPTVIVEEPPNVLVNPPRGTFGEGRVTHFEALLKEALAGTGAKVKIKFPRHGDVNLPYVEVTNIDYDAIAADMDLLTRLNKLVRTFGVDYELTSSGVVIGRPQSTSRNRKSKKKAKPRSKRRNFDFPDPNQDDSDNDSSDDDNDQDDDLGLMRDRPEHFSLAELEAMPTISTGHMDDLKYDEGAGWRVWISRMTVEDGADCDNLVTVERLQDGRWSEFETYEPD